MTKPQFAADVKTQTAGGPQGLQIIVYISCFRLNRRYFFFLHRLFTHTQNQINSFATNQ